MKRLLVLLLLVAVSVVGTAQAGDSSQLTFEGNYTEAERTAIEEQVDRPEMPVLPRPITVKFVEYLDGALALGGCLGITTTTGSLPVITHEYAHVYDCQALDWQANNAILELNDVALSWRAPGASYLDRPIERYAGTFAEYFGPTHYLNTRFQTLVPFTDMADEPEEVQDAVVLLYELGITKGTSVSTFSPDRAVTRAEMALFLARLYEVVR